VQSIESLNIISKHTRRNAQQYNSRPANGSLLCFSGNELKAFAPDVSQFGDEFAVRGNDIISFIDNANCLVSELNLSNAMMRFRKGSESDDEDGESRPTGAYCGDKACGRNYPHEHIKSSSSSSSQSYTERVAPTFARRVDSETGADALAENAFSKF